jgi:hypothetical protein
LTVEDNKFNVWLNGAKLMQAIRTGKTDFDEVIAKDTLVQARKTSRVWLWHP